MKPTIIYTITDEAPALATVSFLPIVRSFIEPIGVDVESRDISLAGRILAAFPDYLKPEQRVSDVLAELGEVVTKPEANIVKLPNISASVPQLTAAIRELQQQGYAVPEYPLVPQTEEEHEIRRRYDTVKGSAVNPVLRQGNSDRRSARAVKEYARKHPHSMGEWSADSRSHVSSMEDGDYFGSEVSTALPAATNARLEHVAADGTTTVLKEELPLLAGEVIDAAVMRGRQLRRFAEREIADARERGVLFSVHLKATMMKVSDPIIFGHFVSAYFAPVFEKHADTLRKLKVHPNNGLRDLYERIADLPDEQRREIEADIQACFHEGPDVSMVDSDRGITNFHVPSDFIIDATIPAAIRTSGKSWGPDGNLHDTKFVVPDRSYSPVYQEVIDFCRTHGAFDPKTMGNVSNVGLMAQKAEEYGSHDKTFEIDAAGTARAVDADGNVLLEQPVEAGDIFRMCQTKDAPIRDWVDLAVTRARDTGAPAVFWLDENRAHDAQVIARVREYLGEHDLTGLDIRIMAPAEATRFTLERLRNGEDTITVTGNVLRDYLTDLFPILELGTSAKMLSIVRLMNGGGLFETGAAGSAPKHVQQFVSEQHLRWDSLGEFLALTVSLEHLAKQTGESSPQILADALDRAIGRLLENGKSPSRKVKELDNRGSHFYLALYWSEELANQTEAPELQERFGALARALRENEAGILQELEGVQGRPVDIGGYFHPDTAKVEAAMRPSETLNRIIAEA